MENNGNCSESVARRKEIIRVDLDATSWLLIIALTIKENRLPPPREGKTEAGAKVSCIWHSTYGLVLERRHRLCRLCAI